MRAGAQPLEADDRLGRGRRRVDDVGAANRLLELAAARDSHLREVAGAREHLLRRARLHAGAEDREDARVGPREKTRGERRSRGGAHRGDVRPVHQRDGRSRRRIEERDRGLVRRAVAVAGKSVTSLHPSPAEGA